MRTEAPPLVRLTDYRPPAFLVAEVRLDFDLAPAGTRVKARLALRRNTAEGTVPGAPLRLDGQRLKLISLHLDGRALGPDDAVLDLGGLTLADVPDAFVLESEVEIDPAANLALEGLYMSGGRFCTQCEAESFRKITFYPDRPDVLSRFEVRIVADQAFPHLLSNGNLMDAGPLPGGRHYAVWFDPFPKPAYLFALVAGELDLLEDSFTTMSGRQVALRIFVDPGMAPRAAYAMDSLKRAMRWDEEVFGREYDLDLFMIVAVRDFNFGAMENKGLNIFNSSLLLADPATATDLDYERIEGVVAHEYFHNWTGNRITCRDWFQLCLKEGLTVFRDQAFSADMRGHAVQRIKEVRALRGRQFVEDASPIAHPVRPSTYVKIDNFYTATIYEKGAELIRMLKLIIGDDAFRAGMDLYFSRHDGEATTVEAFIACFAEASGRDLDPFFTWYEQAGTPRVSLETAFDQEARRATLSLRQSTAPTPGQPTKRPLTIPVALGLIDAEGEEIGETRLVLLEGESLTLEVPDLDEAPVVSALRGFSAPVTLDYAEPARDAYLRLAADPDLFNRWEAGQGLARDLILGRAAGRPDEVGEERFADALGRALRDQASDPAFKALLLALPSETDLALMSRPADPRALHEARDALRRRIAAHLADLLRDLHGGLQDGGEFSADAAAAGRRALRNAALIMLCVNDHLLDRRRAKGHFDAAANMTDAMGGLTALIQRGGEEAEAALAHFYETWKAEPLVIDKWFSVQAQDPGEGALGRVLGLTAHPAFEPRNPNRVRSLALGFAVGNPARFHDAEGGGYRFLADQVLAADAFNPNLAARLVEPLTGWRNVIPALGEPMRAELARLAAVEGLSAHVRELAEKGLA